MVRIHGFEKENFGEWRKKMTRAVPGHHFVELEPSSQLFRSTDNCYGSF